MIDAKSVEKSINSRKASWEAADNDISDLPNSVFKAMLGSSPVIANPADIAAASAKALALPAPTLGVRIFLHLRGIDAPPNLPIRPAHDVRRDDSV